MYIDARCVRMANGIIDGQFRDSIPCVRHRQRRALAHVPAPFIFVTGYPQAHLPERYRERPIVSKPFSEPDLLARVGALLEKKGEPC